MGVKVNYSNGNYPETFRSHYFKNLPENEALYFIQNIKKHLDNIVNIEIIDYNDTVSKIKVSFNNEELFFTVDNTIINIFEDFVPFHMYHNNDEYYKWEKLIGQTVGQIFPFFCYQIVN